MLSLKDKGTIWSKWTRNKGMLSAVETAFEGIAQTRKRLMIEWANEIWREVENTAILLDQEAGDPLGILKEQEKLSETILEYFILNSAKTMLFSSMQRPLKEYRYDATAFCEAVDYVQLDSSQLLFGPYVDEDTQSIDAILHDQKEVILAMKEDVYAVFEDSKNTMLHAKAISDEVYELTHLNRRVRTISDSVTHHVNSLSKTVGQFKTS